MKKFFALLLSFGALGCSQQVGTGELDLGSLSEDMSYHAQSESLQTGSFSYVKINLFVNGNFEQSEVEWDSSSGKKCVLAGTWEVPQVDVNEGTGNELVLIVTHVNGNILGTPKEKRYDLRELTRDTLKVRYVEDADEVDLTNIDYVEFPEYSSANTAGFADDDFCDR